MCKTWAFSAILGPAKGLNCVPHFTHLAQFFVLLPCAFWLARTAAVSRLLPPATEVVVTRTGERNRHNHHRDLATT